MAWKPDYVTVLELKSELHMEAGDTADDAQLARWVTSASRAVDDWAHRQFGQTAAPETREYVAEWDPHEGAWFADVDDLGTLAALVVQWVGATDPIELATPTVAGYKPLERNALQVGMVYERLKITSGAWSSSPWPRSTTCSGGRELEVTATWGWPAVPVAVKQATMLQAMRLAARRDSPFGIAGSPENGGEIQLRAKLDVDAQTTLGTKYRRDWWAA